MYISRKRWDEPRTVRSNTGRSNVRLMPCQRALKRREWTRLVLVFPNKLCSILGESILGELWKFHFIDFF